MCGIAGVVGRHRAPAEAIRAALVRSLQHRGPDDSGWISHGATLVSTRLAILDLSARGHMPMSSPDGRFTIVHNGEIYNHRALRPGLERLGWQFRSGTDTEVVLASYALRGPMALDDFNGMFAFAIWDELVGRLFVARDRYGVKPVVYAEHDGCVWFASEAKALHAAGVPVGVDEAAMSEILRFRSTAGARTPFTGIKRLPPGSTLTVDCDGARVDRWWSPPAPSGVRHTPEELESLLDDAVQLRLLSDVPVGVLLSGGLDSSTVAACLGDAASSVSAFTVRFADAVYDEGQVAALVAKRFGLAHHELVVADEDLFALLNHATVALDEPLVHANDPHLLAISRVARQHVTVLLSGEGADELAAGYVRHLQFLYPRLSRTLARVPLRGRLGKLQRLRGLDPMSALVASSAEDTTLAPPLEPELAPARWEAAAEAISKWDHPLRQVLHYDQLTYLPTVLDRNDRMTMATSVECREPLLDHRLAQHLADLPTRSLVHRGRGKAPLRRAMSRRLPREVLEHRKWGFGVPWPTHLRSVPELTDLVRALPTVSSWLPVDGALVRSTVDNFLAGDDSRFSDVRQLLFVALWREACVEPRRS